VYFKNGAGKMLEHFSSTIFYLSMGNLKFY